MRVRMLLLVLSACVLNMGVALRSEEKLAPANRLEAHGFPQTGKLVLYGGDSSKDLTPTDDLLNLIYRDAGDTEVVYIPTAYRKWDDALQARKAQLWEEKNLRLRFVHAVNREAAFADGLADPIKTARVVYIGGGEQEILAERYIDTPVQKELHAFRDRGGTIVGSSAGMAAMAKDAIHDQREVDGVRQVVTGPGLDLIGRAITETHYLTRNRRWRIEQMQLLYPLYPAFAVDERTALVLTFGAETYAEVLGESEVHYFPPANGAESQHHVLTKGSNRLSLTMK